jgi:hypothetical protein
MDGYRAQFVAYSTGSEYIRRRFDGGRVFNGVDLPKLGVYMRRFSSLLFDQAGCCVDKNAS